MERDYWRLREVETRCRLLFDSSNEAVVLLKASDSRVVEANPVAVRSLGLAGTGGSDQDFLQLLAPEERGSFEAMLLRARDQGKAPGVVVHVGPARKTWLVRASMLSTQRGLMYLLQLTPGGVPGEEDTGHLNFGTFMERAPDGLVIIDRDGVVLGANRAFLEMAEVGEESTVVGNSLQRWLGRPGADVKQLISTVVKQGTVRLFVTALNGELGSAMEVEVAAAADDPGEPRNLGLLVREVTARLPRPLNRSPDVKTAMDQLGRVPLRSLVKESVAMVERVYIEAAMKRTDGNRTAAAELLGMSRQSLYDKLGRYDLD